VSELVEKINTIGINSVRTYRTMDGERAVLRCHTCNNIQRDRRSYRDHLLRVHGEVSRRSLDAPVRLQERELAVVWASVRAPTR